MPFDAAFVEVAPTILDTVTSRLRDDDAQDVILVDDRHQLKATGAGPGLDLVSRAVEAAKFDALALATPVPSLSCSGNR